MASYFCISFGFFYTGMAYDGSFVSIIFQSIQCFPILKVFSLCFLMDFLMDLLLSSSFEFCNVHWRRPRIYLVVMVRSSFGPLSQ